VGAVLNDAEESDWRQLAEEATPWLLSQVREQAGDGADIENIVTESLVRLYAHWTRCRPKSAAPGSPPSPAIWLSTTGGGTSVGELSSED
jgi:DNA-directed RNA polymerase specialized sigma24 family protein